MKRMMLLTAACFFVVIGAWADDKKDAGKKPTDKKWVYVDLQAKANHKLADIFHAKAPTGNNLADLPTGEQTLEGVKFKIGEKYLQLGSKMLPDQVDKLEGIQVGKKCGKL